MSTPEPEQPPFKVFVFGAPRIERSGEAVPLSPSQAALLGVLAARGPEGMTRTELKNLFWTTGTDAQVSQRLTQLFYMVKQRLGSEGCVLVADDPVRLNPELVTTDLEDFQRAVSESRLEDAWTMLRRGVLSGPRIRHSEEMEAIRYGVEARLRTELQKQSSVVWGNAVSRMNVEKAVEASLTLTRLAPHDVTVLRQHVLALGLQGREDEALKYVENFDPGENTPLSTSDDMREIRELCERLPRIAREQARSLFRGPALSLEASPMVGREREMDALLSLLGDVRGPMPRCILVTGSTGVGKTRLVSEALRTTGSQGCVVVSYACKPYQGDVPLEALSQLVEKGLAQRSPDDSDLNECVVFLSCTRELRTRRGNAPTNKEWEALHSSIKQLSGGHPIILWLDNIHYSDVESLHLLCRLLIDYRGPHLTLILTHDDNAQQYANSASTEPFLGFIADRAHQLELSHLSRADTERLLQALSSRPIDVKLADALHSHSGGNPGAILFAVSPTRVRHEEGLPLESLIRPLPDVLRFRMRGMNSSRRLIIFLLATIGRPITLEALDFCLGDDKEWGASFLSGVIQAGWVVTDGAGLVFTPPALNDSLRSLSPKADVIQWCARFASWLKSQGHPDGGTEIAIYLERSGQYLAAAEQALSAASEPGDFQESAALATLLDSLAQRQLPVRTRRDLHAAAGSLHLRTGDLERASDAFSHAYDLADRIREPRGETLWLLIQRLHAESQLLRPLDGAFERQIYALQQECLRSGQFSLAASLTDIILRLAFDSRDASRFERGVDSADRLAMADNLPTRDRTSLLLTRSTDLSRGMSPDAERALTEAISLARAMSEPTLVARALNWRIIQLYHQGVLNCQSGLEARIEAERATKALLDVTLRFRLPLNMAVWYLDTYDLETCQICLDRASFVVQTRAVEKLQLQVLFNQGDLDLQSGNYEDALRRFSACAEKFAVMGDHPIRWLAISGKSLAISKLGSRAEAQQLMAAVPTGWSEGWGGDASLYHAALLECAGDAHTRARLLQSVDQATRTAATRSVPWWIRLVLVANTYRRRVGLPIDASQIEKLRAHISGLQLPHVMGRINALDAHQGMR